MFNKHFKVITNNPLVLEKLKNEEDICYLKVTYKELLFEVKKLIFDGYKLLSHPLSGSVKPGETPYKSILISSKKENVDVMSVKMIERAIDTANKFVDRTEGLRADVLSDFQIVDSHLLDSALISANRI